MKHLINITCSAALTACIMYGLLTLLDVTIKSEPWFSKVGM